MKRQSYKRLIISLLLLTMVVLASGCASKEVIPGKENEEGSKNGIFSGFSLFSSKEGLVAKVNNEEITEEEFKSEFELYKNEYEKQYGEDFMAKVAANGETNEENLKNDILEKLIIEKILFKEIKDKGITVTDEELKTQIDIAAESIGGQELFDEHLEKNGLTQEVFAENIRKQILLVRHREEFNNATVISDEQAKEYFEMNKEDLVVIKVSHILVETEEEGKDILKRLDEGENFGAIALIESRDSISAMDGGNLGYLTKGILPVEFEEVAFSLKLGEISELIKSDVGYQIIYLEDRKDTYEALEKDLKHLLAEVKYMEKLENLRETAKVKVYGEFDKK